MRSQIKKYLIYTLIGFTCLMLFGFLGSIFESWEKTPSFTPEVFLSDVEKAEALNATNHLPVAVYSTDTGYNFSSAGGAFRRGGFQRPTLCSNGTLYQNNSTRTAIRCNKSFIKIYELADTSKQTFDHAVQSIERENWIRVDSVEQYNKTLNTLVTEGKGTLRFKNDRISLSLSVKNRQDCIEINMDEYFCDEDKQDVAFVTVVISADYSDF